MGPSGCSIREVLIGSGSVQRRSVSTRARRAGACARGLLRDEDFTRNHEAITAEAAPDGIYVLRTSLPNDTLAETDVVARYKNLADVERFFRTLNGELDVRPIRHHLADRVRAHVFLRMPTT